MSDGWLPAAGVADGDHRFPQLVIMRLTAYVAAMSTKTRAILEEIQGLPPGELREL